MPRKAPKEVIEHRITFGDFERKELRDAINAYQGDKIAENIPNYILGAAGLVAGGAAALAAYALWRWLDLGAITDFIEDGWNTVKDGSLDLASAIGIGPNFKERVTIDLSQMTTEDEILAYTTPLIAKIDKDIARYQEYESKVSDFPMGGGLKNGPSLVENRKALKRWLISQQNFWLMQVASKGGAPEFQARYGLGLLLQRQYQEWQNANQKTLPSIEYSNRGGINEANREIWRDSFTVWMNEFVGNYNAANPDKTLQYEPPTGYSGDFLEIKGVLYELQSGIDTNPRYLG